MQFRIVPRVPVWIEYERTVVNAVSVLLQNLVYKYVLMLLLKTYV